ALKLDYLKEELEAQVGQTVKNEQLAYTGIRLIIGAAPDEKVEVERQQLPAPPEMPDRAQLLARALERRPEARAAREGVKARQELVGLQRSMFWPDLALVAGTTLTYTGNVWNPPSAFGYNPYNERS